MERKSQHLTEYLRKHPASQLVPLTLVYVAAQERVLLIHREKNRIFGNQWLGLGGKVESREDITSAAVREVQEECGLTILNPVLRGNLVILDETDEIRFVYIFIATEYSGDIQYHSNEGTIQWHAIAELQEMADLVTNQNIFLIRMLSDPTYFYYGILLLSNGIAQTEISSDAYFTQRDSKQ